MPENGEDVNTDVAIRNNAQQRVITEVRGRTESGELGPIARVGCFYSPNCLEEVFSETQGFRNTNFLLITCTRRAEVG